MSNDTPAAFDLGAYFGSLAGDGNDLTLYFQTLSGAVSFSVADTTRQYRGRFRQQFKSAFADAQTLLEPSLRAVIGLFSRLRAQGHGIHRSRC